MTTCRRCGHTVEVGRFCTNCGAPVDTGSGASERTDTAERPAAGAGRPPGPPPPPLPPPPSAARYPLFADEVDGAEARTTTPPTPPPSSHQPPTTPTSSHRSPPRRGSGWLIGLAIAALLVVIALGGAVLLLSDGGDGDDERADDPGRAASTAPETEQGAPPPDPSSSAPTSETPAGVSDVAGTATAEVPSTRAPGTAVDGSRIRFDADQMLDGDPTTSWQMEGDGTGTEIVLTLAGPTALSEVGLINGYAKTDRDRRGREIDWYAGNRRVLAVEWVLDDGTTVAQTLDDATPSLQSVPVEAVETSTVTLRLVEVSAPGRGRDARDNTAISEIALIGAAAG
jgi:hypothetical protein